MLVLNLCQQFCPEKIPVPTGERLGHGGADGETFVVENDPDKAIKLSVIYDRFDQSPISIYQKEIVPILDFIMTTRPMICATVYEHGYLGEHTREMPHWKNGYQKFVIHYCIMERLLPLTEDEKKVFHTLISHEDREIKKDLSPEKIKETLQGLARGLDFDAEMITLFCERMRETNFTHSDIHQRNILKDTNGNFKFVDFDRAILEK